MSSGSSSMFVGWLAMIAVIVAGSLATDWSDSTIGAIALLAAIVATIGHDQK